MQTRSLVPKGPLDLRKTLAPLTLAWGRFANDGWWRPMRTPLGPATVRVTRSTASVDATAWGSGAEWALDRLGLLIGEEDDLESFDPEHPVVRDLWRRHPGVRFGCTSLVFDAVSAAVVAQKVTGKEAARGLRGLTGRFSQPAPGPHPSLRLPPDPELLASAPYHSFHDLGIERRRADVLRTLAKDAARIDRLAGVPSGEARCYLERFPGVGEWTSAETVTVSHGDPDAVSFGDFHLKHLVSWMLAGEARGTDERMAELLDPFRPHRTRVVRLCEISGRYPRYGPRMPLRSFTDR